ncbi:motility protein A [Romboutsia sedimentorum]|uniref:Motility protein A n=1 Tax=Romboutsia sedimentorum TaxID=1368474 RepID=A0ABT7E7J2_9FIRM|nr:motility protein A [Romboutsia sedimentorum]MDK2562672.1 motility protein A [Romboutsia sedimentorum]
MKKQDILTPIGLILAVGLILFGSMQGDTSLSIFFDPASIAITIGGSFAAVLITFSSEDLKKLFKIIKLSFTSSNIYKMDLVDQFKELSRKVRKDGVLTIEDEVSEIEDDFLRRGLELVIDGMDVETINEILELEMLEVENSYDKGSRIFKVWGTYAPAFGMIGTLIGLIQMLADMGTPDVIASGMSKALITTFYGALLSNIILNPIGFNIQNKGQKEIDYREMMLCGITSIQNGDSTRIIEEKLITFLNTEEKLKYYDRVVEDKDGDRDAA